MFIQTYPKGIYLKDTEENIELFLETTNPQNIGKAFSLARRRATMDHWTDFITQFNYKLIGENYYEA